MREIAQIGENLAYFGGQDLILVADLTELVLSVEKVESGVTDKS